MNKSNEREPGLKLKLAMTILWATLFQAALTSYAMALAADVPSQGISSDEHVEQIRQQAGLLSRKGTVGDLKSAAVQLESALEYLTRADIQEISTGSMPLYFRGHDVRFDLARVYARLGEKGKALSTLEEMQRFAWISQAGALTAEDDFALLKDEPRFKRWLANAAVSERLWKVPAIATPYQEQLSIEERVAGLSLY